MLTSSFDPNYTFTSEAANLEYSILSAILGNPSPPDSATTPPPDLQYPRWSSESIDMTANMSPPYTDSQMSLQQSDSGLPNANGNSAHYLSYPFSPGQSASPTELAYSASYSSQTSAVQPLQGRYSVDHQSRSPVTSMHLSASKDAQACEPFSLLPSPVHRLLFQCQEQCLICLLLNGKVSTTALRRRMTTRKATTSS